MPTAEPTVDELKARIAELEAQKTKTKDVTFKVSEKGAVSVYGLGRFPVTLYLGQWTRLFEVIDQLKAFIETNKDQLSVKE
jgi:hypothetical protein